MLQDHYYALCTVFSWKDMCFYLQYLFIDSLIAKRFNLYFRLVTYDISHCSCLVQIHTFEKDEASSVGRCKFRLLFPLIYLIILLTLLVCKHRGEYDRVITSSQCNVKYMDFDCVPQYVDKASQSLIYTEC